MHCIQSPGLCSLPGHAPATVRAQKAVLWRHLTHLDWGLQTSHLRCCKSCKGASQATTG